VPWQTLGQDGDEGDLDNSNEMLLGPLEYGMSIPVSIRRKTNFIPILQPLKRTAGIACPAQVPHSLDSLVPEPDTMHAIKPSNDVRTLGSDYFLKPVRKDWSERAAAASARLSRLFRTLGGTCCPVGCGRRTIGGSSDLLHGGTILLACMGLLPSRTTSQESNNEKTRRNY
jgi:hypothetical protein